MTTELPSGESSRAGTPTELKNSSRVSLGLLWAWAMRAKVSAIATTTGVFWIRIGFPVGRRVIQRGIRWNQVGGFYEHGFFENAVTGDQCSVDRLGGGLGVF